MTTDLPQDQFVCKSEKDESAAVASRRSFAAVRLSVLVRQRAAPDRTG